MTRREFVSLAAAKPEVPVVIPVRLMIDVKAQYLPGRIEWFQRTLWPEAVRDFRRAGVVLAVEESTCEVLRPQQREPVIGGLHYGVLNVVATNQVPMYWDATRALSGVSMVYRDRHLSIIATSYAHGHLIPMVAVNTCVHELLHVLLADILEPRPQGWAGERREARVDWLATRMWIYGDSEVRAFARAYLARINAARPA